MKKWISYVAIALFLLFFCGCAGSQSIFEKRPTHNWTMVTTWSETNPWYWTASYFAKTVETISDGDMKITVLPAGGKVTAFQVFDAVKSGVVEMGHDWPGYWKSKNEAFVAFASVPFGLNNMEYSLWLFGDEGWDLARKLYGKYGLVPFPAGNSGQEMGFFTKEPIDDVRELKGKKVRTVGWLVDILTKAGVEVLTLPGGEVYSALKEKEIDAAEFSTPYITHPLKLHKMAKNVIMPGWHQPSVQLMVMVNKDAYESLPSNLKEAFKIAAYATQMWDIAHFERANAEAINKFKAEGVKFNITSKQSLKQMKKVAKEVIHELEDQNPLLKEILASQSNFVKRMAVWHNLSKDVSSLFDED